MMRSFVIAAAALAILSACGAPSGTGATGTVTGYVRATPCTPVERVGDSPCAGLPVADVQVRFFNPSGGQAGAATTDSTGYYTIHLPAGSYTARVTSRLGIPTSRSVTVTTGATVTLDLMVDSGIR